jgi:hypothetical protein
MKKLVLFAAIAVVCSLSACKKAAPAAEQPIQEEVTTVVEEPAVQEGLEAAAEGAETVTEDAPVQ